MFVFTITAAISMGNFPSLNATVFAVWSPPAVLAELSQHQPAP